MNYRGEIYEEEKRKDKDAKEIRLFVSKNLEIFELLLK